MFSFCSKQAVTGSLKVLFEAVTQQVGAGIGMCKGWKTFGITGMHGTTENTSYMFIYRKILAQVSFIFKNKSLIPREKLNVQ